MIWNAGTIVNLGTVQGEGDYSFSAGNARMEIATTTSTIISQYGIGECTEFSLRAFMDITEASYDGDVDAILPNQVMPILLL